MKTNEKRKIEDIFALTPMQEGMLYHYLKNSKNELYFEQLSLTISGKLKIECFEEAWNIVIEENEMLRATFQWEKLEKPVQIILKNQKCNLRFYDLSDSDNKLQIEKIKEKDRKKYFNLREVPFRVTLLKTGEKRYEVIISFHHILFDGWSTGIILKEFFNTYCELIGQGKSLQKVYSALQKTKARYKEYIIWLKNRKVEKQKKFWAKYLKEFSTQTRLPIKINQKGKIKGFEDYTIHLKEETKESIDEFTKKNRLTLAGLFYTGWGILLLRYCHTDSVIFGTTVSGRPPSAKIEGIENTVGLFINTIPLGLKINPKDRVKTIDVLHEVNQTLQIREPFESTSLVEINQWASGECGEELFDTIIVVENYPLDSKLMGANTPLPFTIDSFAMKEAANYDLTLGIKTGEKIDIHFNYNRQWLDSSRTIRLSHHFLNIINSILTDSQRNVSEIEILTEKEKKQILYDFNTVTTIHLKKKTIHGLYAEQVEKTPDHTALVDIVQSKQITYLELNNWADRLALELSMKGIKPDTIAAIIIEPGIEMMIGIFAILKAGGAYLPIDPTIPKERIEFMLSESGIELIVTSDSLVKKVETIKKQKYKKNIEIISLNPLPSMTIQNSNFPNFPFQSQQPAASLAYIIYTSGSTGKPKGVMVEHQGVVNMLEYRKEQYGLKPGDRLLQLFSYAFDGFVTSMFTPIISGATIVLLGDEGGKDIAVMRRAIANHQVTHFISIPQLFHRLIGALTSAEASSLKVVTLAGDIVSPQIFDLLRQKRLDIEIATEYGVTEASVMSTIGRHQEKEKKISIGKPIGNTQIFILHQENRLQPVGVPGELCIAGLGPARGYLNNPELTTEKFIKLQIATNSFRFTHKEFHHSTTDPLHLSPLYKSGDLARWLPDGDIEFLGRIDHQVKIRGFRIETGEIENRLTRHDTVNEALVMAKEDRRGDKYLCAYLVLKKTIDSPALKHYLAEELPGYMIPSYFIPLESFPLTSTGKIDRRALPQPGIERKNRFIAPRDEIEKKLTKIWVQVLDCRAPGITDDFFQLGGHSLKAITLAAKIHKEFQIDIPLTKLFENPSIEALAQIIRGRELKSDKYESIKPVELKDYYLLSSAQRRLYFLQQVDKTATVYNIPSAWLLTGKSDKSQLEQIFRKLIQRHECFRTSFRIKGEKPVQHIRHQVEFSIQMYSIDSKITKHQENSLILKTISKFLRPFDLSCVPLLRVGLINIEEEKSILMVDMHHIIADGASIRIVVEELTAAAEWKALPPLKLQYKDFSEWQRKEKELNKQSFKKQEKYWLKKLDGEIPVLNLPSDFRRPAVQSFTGNSLNFEFPVHMIRELEELAQQERATQFMVLLAIYNIFLGKISNSEEIIIGTPVVGRRHVDLSQIIGMFANTLVLRSHPAGEKTFRQFLKETRDKTRQAFENQDYLYEDLVERVAVNREPNRNPLFDVVFALQDVYVNELPLAGTTLKPYTFQGTTAKFDLTLIGEQPGENLLFTFEYSTKLFKAETVKRFIDNFKRITAEVLKNHNIKIAEINIISEKEKNVILSGFNDTSVEYSRDKTIHQLFEQQVEKVPNHIALIGTSYNRQLRHIHLSYNELDSNARQLGLIIRERGGVPDTRVGIMLNRSLEMMIAILAVLKAGAAYLPLDPDYPEERLRYMLNDSQVLLLLTQSPLNEKVNNEKNIFLLEDIPPPSLGEPPLKNLNRPEDLAYIMYTSGSTGKPKGVLVEHRNVVRLVKNTNFVELTEETRILQTGAPVFDATTFEIWGPLLNGGQLVLVDKAIVLDANQLGKGLKKYDINTLWLSSPLFNQLARVNDKIFSNLQYLLVGGDILTPEYVNRVRHGNKNLKIINGYGPTENTTFSVTYSIDMNFETSIPIGSPINNSTAFIRNKYGLLQPIGIFGELWVGGDGVSRGYLNAPELTHKKFFPDTLLNGKRLYCTGDIARWYPDGNIEFAGRTDEQVKIRGFRIELQEIEQCLMKYEGVKEALVITTVDDNRDKYLCAYISGESQLSTLQLRKYLSQELPEYMIPSYFVILEAMPLTPNGKIDRAALPKPDKKTSKKAYTPPANRVEKQLAAIWKEVLGKETGIDDNFFEWGGHSLKATFLAAKMQQIFHIEVPISEIFIKPTIRELGEYIENAVGIRYRHPEPGEEKEYYPLSSAQKRLYFLQKMEVDSVAYNLPYQLLLEGQMDKARLEKTIQRLIQRHESFRTSFQMIDEEPVQLVHKGTISFSISTCNEDFTRPFDLSRPPLLRVGLVKLAEKEHRLMLDMHHIISDGMSMEILVREFMIIYQGNIEALTSLKLRYRDFSEWQNNRQQQEIYKQQGNYWRNQFADEVPVLYLPADYPRPAVQSFAGNEIRFQLDEETTKALKTYALEKGATLFMVLLSIYTIFLSKLSNQEDIVVGTPVAGRRHSRLDSIIGMFVNTLPLRNFPAGHQTFSQFLDEVKNRSLQAFTHQDYLYEELVETVAVDRDTERNPLFDTMFSLQNLEIPELQVPGLKIKHTDIENNISKFDLTLTMLENNGTLSCVLEYCTQLFKKQTIRRFIQYFHQTVSSILENPHGKVREIEIISAEEKEQIIFDFNRTHTEIPQDSSIIEIFEQQAMRFPHRSALVGEELRVKNQGMVTYDKLAENSTRLAILLKRKGVKTGTFVGIIGQRSIEMVTAIFAILEAGGAYLPISPNFPMERIRYILKDSSTKLLLTQTNEYTGIEDICTVLNLKKLRLPSFSGKKRKTLKIPTGMNDLAYVIYTSGSTGTPKGVLVRQQSLLNLIWSLATKYPLGKKDGYILKTPVIFDVSVAELFGWFIGGGRLIILETGGEKDPQTICTTVARTRVTHINFVPSMFNAFVYALNQENIAQLSALKYIFLAGEALMPELVEKFRQLNRSIILENLYGPTETTVYASSYCLTHWKPGESIPIGKPLQNTILIILNFYGLWQPVGVPGELAISGVGIGNGYLNRPELTAQKFCYQDSRRLYKKFILGTPHSGGSIYRTGDLTRWQPDGNIQFLGRIDLQVKIRGYRIELGEIENQLLKHEGVKQAAVIDLEKNGDRYLCAYVVPSPKDESPTLTSLDLRTFLSSSLPDYMIPSHFVTMENMPLGAGGKINRKALPEPQSISGKQYTPPQNKIEEKLVHIWSEALVLEKNSIGIDDGFFHLGGHSLKAITITAKIQQLFGVKVPLMEIFKRPTIRSQATYIEKCEKSRSTTIEALEEKEYYPVSSAQRRLFFLQQINKQSTTYNVPALFILSGDVHQDKFEEIFNCLIQRHENLRTSFPVIKGEPVQWIHKQVKLAIGDFDSTPVENGDTPVTLGMIKPFELSQAPLLRVGMTVLKPQEYLLAIDMHHIISDGLSIDIFVKEFTTLYTGQPLSPLRIQYKDYTHWQLQEKKSPQYLNQAAYWQKQFLPNSEIPELQLPLDFPRSNVQSYEGRRLLFDIDSQKTEQLKQLALDHETTLFMVLLALFNVFLSKITGQETIVVGTATAGRDHPQLEPIIGMFVNTLPIINTPESHKSFTTFLKEVDNKTLQAFENRDYPFEDLVEAVTVKRETGRNPLFDVMFTLQNPETETIHIPALTLRSHPFENNTAKFDLMLQAIEKGNLLSFSFEYSTNLFKESTIQRLIQFFEMIVTGVLKYPALQLSDIEIISSAEKRQVLIDFNDTSMEYPREKSIQQIFAEDVKKHPHQIALKVEEDTLSYRTLDLLSHHLAIYLQDRGAKSGIPVGIMLKASVEIIVGVLAILKTGSGYLPIDPEYPQERIDYMLKDSGAKLVVTTDHLVRGSEKVRKWKRKKDIDLIFLNTSSSLTVQDYYPLNSHLPPVAENRKPETSLAYIIYTSGSTGSPKGVMVEHRNVIRLVKNTKFIDLQSHDRILQTGALEFDASTFEIWGALLNGLTLYLAPKERLLNPKTLKEILQTYCISTIWMTAPLFNQMVQLDEEIFAGLRNLLVGGDVLSPPHINRIKRRYPYIRIINGYGPTENTTFSATFTIDREYRENIPIGKPITNSTAYIVADNGQPQPIGIAGELWVGGDGVSRGYMNNPEMTAEKFLTTDRYGLTRQVFKRVLNHLPNRTLNHSPIYQTGDLACWLLDGNIRFLGRKDQQVKIRGFRVEPREIEIRLLTHVKIREAVVLARKEKNNEKYLCAYLVPEKSLELSEIKHFLSCQLPDYMIPSYFIILEQIPLTPNGKVDWRALPEPQKTSEKDFIPPRDDVEQKLANIWAEILVLPKEEISIHSDFFQLGGHSLKAVLLTAKIHKVFDAEIPLIDIFTHPSLQELADYIKDTAIDEYIPINLVEKRDYYAASSAQKRLYVLQDIDKGGVSYNIPTLSILEGNLNSIRLKETFKQLVQRHDSLRTSFVLVNNEPVQRLYEKVELELDNYIQLGKNQSVLQTIDSFIRPFDLSQAPLIRVELVEIEPQKHLLMVDMHHIVSDGTSMNILVSDFMSLYNGEVLTPLTHRYIDFSFWQSSQKQKEKIKQQEEFWQKQFADEIPVLHLPLDYPRPGVQSFAGELIRFQIPKKDVQALKSWTQKENTTLFIFLLSIYTILLSKLSDQVDIVVGTPIAGRNHADLEKIIGMFVNTLALRNSPQGEKTAKHFLQEVKDQTLQAFAHQDYPYEDLVEAVAVQRDSSRNPLFDTMFALQNMDNPKLEIQGLSLLPYENDDIMHISKFDLTLMAVETKDNLLFTLEYCKKLFKKQTIQRYTRYLKKIISAVVESPESKISTIEIISEKEKRQILNQINNPGKTYPNEKTLLQLIEEQIRKTPDHIAMVGETLTISQEVHFSYLEMKKQSRQVAQVLKNNGVKPGIIAGIMMERSIDLIIGILGILKTGGAYLPLSPTNPDSRTAYMLADSGASILVTSRNMGENIPFERENIYLPLADEKSKSEDWCTVSPNSIAYIIYTSGSTGKPKGVLTTHGNVCPLLHWGYELGLDSTHRHLQNISFSFDWSVWVMFMTFTTGAALYLVNDEIRMNSAALGDYITRHLITVINLTPTQFQHFLTGEGRLPTLKYLFLGAEMLTYDLVKRGYETISGDCRVFNVYGPTETTILSTALEIPPGNDEHYQSLPSVPIGTSLANTFLLILDKDMHICPVNVVGELYIGGDNIAPGYLNQPELTAMKFIATDRQEAIQTLFNNKFLQGSRHRRCRQSIEYIYKVPPGRWRQKIYKSGDLVRLLPSGGIEFIGRIDHQVKIRGFRIELGEIANRLRTHEKVKDAEVMVKERKPQGDKYICAYIVAKGKVETAEIQNFLSKQLPEYMIPNYFVMLPHMPVNPNGKIDRKALPEPEPTSGAGDRKPPVSEIEKKIAEIWAEVLSIEKDAIGIDSHFFDLGGHSLKASAALSMIHKKLNIKVPLAEFFRTPTIKGLTGYLEGTGGIAYQSITPSERKIYYELSSAQRRIFILQQVDLESTNYNMPGVFVLEGKLDKKRFDQAFQDLCRHHETLRTSFTLENDQEVQRISSSVRFNVEYRGKNTQEDIELHIKNFIKPFDLSQAPLLRVQLLDMEEEKHLILFDMHHIISDGTSMKILINDFARLYNREPFLPLPIQYKDYAAWQNKQLKGETFKKQETYWLKQLEGFTFTQFPVDHFDSYKQVEGKEEPLEIDTAVFNRIEKFCTTHNVTRFTFMITIFTIVLAKEIDQDDITIGIPASIRDHVELKKLIGVFLNVLLIRTTLDESESFLNHLLKNKKNIIDALDNQDYPYEVLDYKIRRKSQIKNNELFSILFNYFPEEIENEIASGEMGIRLTSLETREISPKYDMTLYVHDNSKSLSFNLVYKANLYDEYSVKSLLADMKNVICLVLEDAKTPLFKLSASGEIENDSDDDDFESYYDDMLGEI